MKKPYGLPSIPAPVTEDRLDKDLADLIMVANRDRTQRPTEKLVEVLEGINDEYTIDTLLSQTSLNHAWAMFDDIYDAEKRVLNLLLTADFQRNNAGLLPSLYEKLFYAVKSICGIKTGKKNIRETVIDNKTLKREFLLARMRADLKEAFQTVCESSEDQDNFVAELLSDATTINGSPGTGSSKPFSPPGAAPALWLERTDRSQTPADFIRNHYAPWLGQGLTQAHIRRLDKSLYMALHQWLKHRDRPADLDLPTKKEMNDRLLEAGAPSSKEAVAAALQKASPELRQRISLYNAARFRARRALS